MRARRAFVKNARPWRFHVVTDHLLLAELASAVEEADDKESHVPFDPATGAPRGGMGIDRK